MRKKISRAILLVSLLVVAISLVFVTGTLYEYFSQMQLNEMKNEVRYLKSGIEQMGSDYLRGISGTSSRITLIAQNGAVLYDSSADESTLENHADREEVRLAYSQGEGSSVRYSTTFSQRTFYYAMLLDDGSVLRLASTRYTLPVILVSCLPVICFTVLLALLLSLVLGLKISRRVVEPINAINPENPEVGEDVYDEISPFIEKIKRQNKEIEKKIAQLKENQEQFDTITANMNEALVLIDAKTNVLAFNKSAEKLFGKESLLKGKSIYALSRNENLLKAVETVTKGEHTQREFSFKGSYYRLMASPVLREGLTDGAVLLIADMTQAHEAERLRREFSANVSHELKTPLTSISGYAEIMKDGIAKEADMRRFAEKIYSESQKLIMLVNDIIKLSQLDEGDIDEEKTPVNLGELVREVLKRLEEKASEKHIGISCEIADVTIKGVAGILEELIYNLVDNAIKYNANGGWVKVNLSEEKQSALLVVSDNGIGIEPAEQKRVFERFYRADKSRSESEGTGLGLSIVKHAAAFHDATIDMTSGIGKGTAISVSFPIYND